MTIQLIVDNIELPIKVITFSDGGTNVKLEVPQKLIDNSPSAYYSISVDPTTPVDNYLWEIALVNDSINRVWGWDKFNKAILHLPYLPHGRADRVFEVGNPHPLEVFLTMIQPCFDEVFLTDPHSNFYKSYEQLIDFTVKSQHQCFIETVRDIKSGDFIVAPDKGALNKIYKLQQALDTRLIATRVLEAGKKRNIETGRVVETTLPEDIDLNGTTCYIVDDLLDAGGTFIPLANKLREAGAKEVNLYVTHGIFSKGLDILKGVLDNIYVYQTVGKYVNLQNINDFNKGI